MRDTQRLVLANAACPDSGCYVTVGTCRTYITRTIMRAMGYEVTLIQQTGPFPGKLFTSVAPETSLGRDPGCTLTLAADGWVSRRHAVILSSGSEVFLQDLGSTNGTFINGELVPRGGSILRSGDVIQIGASAFRVELAKVESVRPAVLDVERYLSNLEFRRLNESAAQRDRLFDLDEVDSMDGHTFEGYVAQLLTHRGYSSVRVTPGSGDFGVDIIAEVAGRRYAVQCKRLVGRVSRHAVSDAVAGKAHYGCDSAMVITSGEFSKLACTFARSTQCDLIGREELTQWIADFRIPRDSEGKVIYPKLVPIDSRCCGASVELRQPITWIGRDKRADISFPDDPLISRVHAEVVLGQSGSEIRDLNSTNGTLVNGVSVRNVAGLADKDIIGVGSHRFRFEDVSRCRDRQRDEDE